MSKRPAGSPQLDTEAALKALLSERLAALVRQRLRVKRGASAGAVHDLRVATRRVQEIVSLLNPWLPPKRARRLVRRARDLRRGLGPQRNADVLAGLAASLEKQVPATLRPGAQAMTRTLADEASRLRRLQKGARPAGVRRCARALLSRWETADALALRARGGATIASRLDALAGAMPGALARPRPDAMHALRILFKKYRYILEILNESKTLEAGHFLAEARALQTALGDLHDLDLLAVLVRRRAPARARGPLLSFLRGRRRALLDVSLARLAAFDAAARRAQLLAQLADEAAA